ncbi:chemotaxis protein [Clostridium porci]|uniref:Chemotaxis protein n=1 Tax=Clostridium porci TaxID=2605778 RepID=A0A7X2NMY1_9CLOT|nr:chemotaxis protein [Clostridium porci]MSS37877.1 chemotaxis protein [Clostridium porci]
MTEELLDQLNQIVEQRVHQIRRGMEGEREQPYQKKIKEDVERMDRILKMLPEKEREWLDKQLLEQLTVPVEERERYYKADLSDAIDLLRFLKR